MNMEDFGYPTGPPLRPLSHQIPSVASIESIPPLEAHDKVPDSHIEETIKERDLWMRQAHLLQKHLESIRDSAIEALAMQENLGD